MKLDEALAVMLYLQHAQRGEHEDRVYGEAWRVICDEADKVIKAHVPDLRLNR